MYISRIGLLGIGRVLKKTDGPVCVVVGDHDPEIVVL